MTTSQDEFHPEEQIPAIHSQKGREGATKRSTKNEQILTLIVSIGPGNHQTENPTIRRFSFDHSRNGEKRAESKKKEVGGGGWRGWTDDWTTLAKRQLYLSRCPWTDPTLSHCLGALL